jgi:hypothetical protein
VSADRRRSSLALLAIAISLAAPGGATAGRGGEPPAEAPAKFAIIVGVNRSVDSDARPLRYADDDAAAFQELFRTLGARTYLLSRFDEGTRRLRPQAFAEAQDPRRRELERLVEQVSADVAQARGRGVPTVVYFVYAGHGNVESGRGYLALEDVRLYGADLERLVVDRIGAKATHFIVDACYSAFLAFSRGPGGERREAHGFSSLGGLAARSGVGLLLSTSSARESHEWSEFQAGVFSHEVRSGLLGAADADGDGSISYREIAAFVDRANAPVANERFRSDVYARAPAAGTTLVDLRPGLSRRLELDGRHPGHYFIEDARGIRLADFHNAEGQTLRLLRPGEGGPLFLRQVGGEDALEYVLDAAPAVLHFEDLHPQPTTAEPRGAAQESFRLLFSLPFSQQVVDVFVERRPTVDAPMADVPAVEVGASNTRATSDWRRPVGIGLLVVGGVAAAGGGWAVASALQAQRESTSSQAESFRANELIDRRNDWARALFGISGAALVGGTVVLLWPKLAGSPPAITVGLNPGAAGGAAVAWTGRF